MIKEAWLIFRDGKHKLQRILKSKFGHISLLYKDDFNWILISPNEDNLEVVILPYNIKANAPTWLAANKTMIVVKVIYKIKEKSDKFPRLLIGFTCVSFVKYFLGYKDFSVTPYQLYKNLRKLKKNIIQCGEL